MTRLLAWQLLNALKLQAVALNWLRFSVFLAWRCWDLWLPGCCSGSSTSPTTGVVGHWSRWWWGWSLLQVLCLPFQNGFYKWWRILDHIIVGAWERGRGPVLGSFFNSICTGWNQNGKLWIKKGLLGRSCSSAGHACSLVFFSEFLKWKCCNEPALI